MIIISGNYDYIQENRIIKEVWKGNIRRIRCIDISGVLPCCVQSLCNPYVHIIETAQHSGHLISIYNFDQEDGNIFLSQSWHQQERVLSHSIRGGIHRFHIVYNPYRIHK